MGRPWIHATVALAAWLAALAPLAARAEVFVLRSGGKIEGEHLNPQRASGQPYQLRTDDGLVLALGENAVARVVIKSDVEREYETKLPGVPNTVDGHWEMAQWCLEAGLDGERRRHLTAVIGLDPNHAEARRVLGYSLYGSQWMTQNEFLISRGYVFHKGQWRLQQEIEIELQNREREVAVKELRQNIRTWLSHIAEGNRHAANSERSLNEIRDPNAAPALVDLLADKKQPRAVRLRCLEILGRLPPGLAIATLVKVAMDDADDTLRDRCLDELARSGTHQAVPGFIAELSSKNNARVLRAAECLRRLADSEAILPLIDALVTEHEYLVSSGAPPGALGAGFGTGPGATGAGTFGVSGKPKKIKKDLRNEAVRTALRTMCPPGVDYEFDEDAWKRWYIQKFTTTNVDLRRSE
jgi:hypothetical protein